MEEVTQVDHRTTSSVFEMDRNSAELLAMTYQRIADFHERFSSCPSSAPASVKLMQNSVLVQEASI
jgi:hypothetical protein